ncbi:MAG: sigma 54-interacting transcriptional regulator [Planctomycetales bacterium]|nr:sigma 54-interacting transcriptional regulator [Planctomycetales bacterium]
MARKRTPRVNDVQRWLGSTTVPLFVLDTERRVSLFNLGCQELTGWPAADVVGQVCQYAGYADVLSLDALTSCLCPPPEAFAGQEVCLPAHLVHKDGTTASHLLHFFPLRDDRGLQIGVLGVVKPFTPAPPHTASTLPVHQLHAELTALRIAMRHRFGTQTLTSRSDVMRRVLSQVELAQQCTVPVCLEGEPGTGKEHVARVIHFGSVAKTRWFVPVDCGSSSPDELQQVFDRIYEESYHESARAAGMQPGTLYLANVDRLPRDLQHVLLHLATPAEPPPKPLPRLIASATNRMQDAVTADRLRPDLFAVLSTLAIELPPLRQRGPDLRLLAQHFVEEINRQGTKQVTGLADDVWKLFEEYRWPGNLKELSAVVSDAHGHCTDNLIRPVDLPFRFRTGLEAQQLAPSLVPRPLPLDDLLEKVERQLILLALERNKYNKTKAAEALRISRMRLYSRMEKLGIEDREASKSESSRTKNAERDARSDVREPTADGIEDGVEDEG